VGARTVSLIFTEITALGVGPAPAPTSVQPFAFPLLNLFDQARFYMCGVHAKISLSNHVTSEAWPTKFGVHCYTATPNGGNKQKAAFLFLKHREHVLTSMTCTRAGGRCDSFSFAFLYLLKSHAMHE
jgi:hypothetical protein